MDIQTKDGILLRGIPEGTPDEDIKARIAQIRASGFQSTGGGAALGGARQPVGDRGGEVTDVPHVIGGNVAEALSGMGASPETAAAGGTAVNVGMNLVPMLMGTGIGAGVGRLGASAVRGIGKGINAAKNVIDPWLPGGINRAVGRTANAAAGPGQQAIINALRANEQIVPGSMPTAGQAAAPVGRAEFSGLQEAVKGRAPTEYENITQAQNAARVKALRTISGEPGAIETAETARKSTTKPLYEAAETQGLDVEMAKMLRPQIKNLLARPAIQPAISKAKQIFGNESIKLAKEGDVKGLQLLKQALDDVIERSGDPASSIGKNQLRGLQTVRKDLISVMEEIAPQLRAADLEFARLSKPISQMQIGRHLEEKLVPALNEMGATGSQRSAAYAKALREADELSKRATGFAAPLEKMMEPEQLKTMAAVGSDLGRAATHERLAKAGSEKARALVGQIAQQVPAAGMFSPHYSVMRAVINRLEGKVEGKSLDALAEAMQPGNLSKLADAMEGMSPRTRAAIVKALQAETLQNRIMTGGGAIAGGAIGYQQGQQP